MVELALDFKGKRAMVRKYLHTYCGPKSIAVVGAAVLAAALLLRYGAFEAGVFPLLIGQTSRKPPMS